MLDIIIIKENVFKMENIWMLEIIFNQWMDWELKIASGMISINYSVFNVRII
jgi:hypothetical protein